LPAQRDALTARAAPGSAVERRDGGQGVPTTSHNRARVSGRPRSDRVSGPPRPSKGPHAHVDGRALQRCWLWRVRRAFRRSEARRAVAVTF